MNEQEIQALSNWRILMLLVLMSFLGCIEAYMSFGPSLPGPAIALEGLISLSYFL
jgi:hypothetical protein